MSAIQFRSSSLRIPGATQVAVGALVWGSLVVAGAAGTTVLGAAPAFADSGPVPVCGPDSCTVTFGYTGAATTWTVPPGVTSATFTVDGAGGAAGGTLYSAPGGPGGRVVGTLASLSAGQVVDLSVGGVGATYFGDGAGGFNGGGSGQYGGGGGGYSAVSVGGDQVLVAGGGGGGGMEGSPSTCATTPYVFPAGGAGGAGGESGTVGASGESTSEFGLTLDGGAGGNAGGTGGGGGAGGAVSGTGTPAASGCAQEGQDNLGAPGYAGAGGGSLTGGGGALGAGGGGGGGYIGGGQGGGGAIDVNGAGAGWGGGGGGSSYAAGSVLSPSYTTGVRSGDGQVEVTYDNPVTATDRAYSTGRDQTLGVTARSGVLTGASAPSGDALTAGRVSGPAHGTLSLNGDGSFVYNPSGGYAGDDSFVYRAVDGSGNAATATVLISVDAPAIVPTCDGRSATIVGATDQHEITGTAGPDVIVALGRDVTIRSGGGDDVICAGAGNDVIHAGSGNDTVRAGGGDDVVRGGSGYDRLHGSSGADRLRGGSGDDRLHGGSGDDRLWGGRGADRLRGGSGHDVLRGGRGPDLLIS